MKRKPYIVEIIGPAGAGKSTLTRALVESYRDAIKSERPQPRDMTNLGFYVGNGLLLLPTFLRRPWTGRWYSNEEAQRLFYLTGMSHRLRRAGQPSATAQNARQSRPIVVLDQGPVFDMAQLTEFGPERLQSPTFTLWWRGMLDRWANMLDMVVWLDAPDSVLIPRVMARAKWHTLKGYDHEQARDFLARYRASYDVNLFRLTTCSPINVLEFRTDREELATIVQHIADAIVQEMAEIQDQPIEHLFA